MSASREPQETDAIAAVRDALQDLKHEFERFIELRIGPAWTAEALRAREDNQSGIVGKKFGQVDERIVGIAGLEGVGKSTLINAIFGQDVVPTDENQPGTAVPIHVCVAAAGPMVIETVSQNRKLRCESFSELKAHTLQRYNPADKERITKAIVTLPCRHLLTSLCLVDLPGLEGMSIRFRDYAKAALEAMDSIILVVQDRNAGPALQLASEILETGTSVDAVVINLQMSKLVETSSLRPRSDAFARDHIERTRDYVANQFLKELPSLKKDCPFFAFHVPSMTALSIKPDSELSLPSHIDEVLRFADWFETTNGLDGTRTRSENLLQEIESCLVEHRAKLAKEVDHLTALSNSDPAALQQLDRSIDTHKAHLRDSWMQETTGGRFKLAAEQAWDEFQPSVTDLKTRLQELHRTTAASVPQDWWSQNRGLADEISNDINRIVTASQKRLETKATACIQRFADTIAGFAQEFAADELALVPLDRGPILLAASTPVTVLPITKPDPLRKSLSEYDSSKIIERLLDELAVLEMSVSSSKCGALFQAFQNALDAHLESCLERLESRLEKLPVDVRNSSSTLFEAAHSRLEEQKQAIADVEFSISKARVTISAFEPLIAKRQQRIERARTKLQEEFSTGSQAPGATVSQSNLELSGAQATITAPGTSSIWEKCKRAIAQVLGLST